MIKELEQWRRIWGTSHYEISNHGRVKNTKTNRILSSSLGMSGYMQICIRDSSGKPTTRYVHREVAKCFVPNKNNYKEVNHKDGVKSNNNWKNLEWVSRKMNCQHAIDNELLNISGEKHPLAKLDVDGVEFALDLYYKDNIRVGTIASMLMVNFHTVDKIIKNISYKKEQAKWREVNKELLDNFNSK